MIHEVKTYHVTCDNCGVITEVHARNKAEALKFLGEDRHWKGGRVNGNHYCDECKKEFSV